MADNGTNGKIGPTWKVIAVACSTVILVLLGYFGNSVHSEIKSLQEKKLDKERYCVDIERIGNDIREIKNDLKEHMRRER